MKVFGEALVPLSLGEGQSALETAFKFLVCEGVHSDLLAMDFLTDFQGVIELGAEETLTLNRRPREPQDCYVKPHLDLPLRATNGKVSRARFLGDTGGTTTLDLKTAKKLGLELVKWYKQNGR